jgi:hypothetical protein
MMSTGEDTSQGQELPDQRLNKKKLQSTKQGNHTDIA